MPVFKIASDAIVVVSDPRSEMQLFDPDSLKALHGLCSEDICSFYLDPYAFEELNVGGGRVRFEFCTDRQVLRVTTAYDVAREPTASEREKLIEATVAQWCTGIGAESFSNHRKEVHSKAQAIALKDSGQVVRGDCFIDATPEKGRDQVTFEYWTDGRSDDVLLSDLKADAASGNTAALIELGQRYREGDGVQEDVESACDCFRQASDKGDLFAMTLYGLMLQFGTGCERDLGEAERLFREAAKWEFTYAIHCLGNLLEEWKPEESVALYRRGADLGHLGCLAELGECLEFGRGVDMDLHEALACYERCMEGGFDAVAEAIQRVKSCIDS